MYWFIYEMDYVFDETLSWSYDSSTTSATEYDLNTIARHETGHASGLGHVNDAQKLMDAYTSRGQKILALHLLIRQLQQKSPMTKPLHQYTACQKPIFQIAISKILG
tara:strand:+ start:702 stop:1022 length:321 start_codon:yes stop_codon:yes gene_type:complete